MGVGLCADMPPVGKVPTHAGTLRGDRSLLARVLGSVIAKPRDVFPVIGSLRSLLFLHNSGKGKTTGMEARSAIAGSRAVGRCNSGGAQEGGAGL